MKHETIDTDEALAAVILYGDAIKSPCCIDMQLWAFNGHRYAKQYRLWVEKTHTHYEYATVHDLMKAIWVKTLLHEKFGGSQ